MLPSTLLAALASIQRHIIIFRRTWLLTKLHRKLFHYFPIIILLLYSIAYGCVITSLITIDGYTYDYTTAMCGRLETWINKYHHLSVWNLIANELLPTPIIVAFSIALIIRVIRQKHRMGQTVTWRKQRKMTIQLLSISFFFCLTNLPPILLHTARLIQDEKYLPGNREAQVYFSYFTYYQCIFLPFVCLISLYSGAKKLTIKVI